METPKLASTGTRYVRREFRHVAARASKITMERPNSLKMCFSAIGLVGLTVTFIFIALPTSKETESGSLDRLRERLFGATNKFSREVVKRLIWSRKYLNILTGYEQQVAGSYRNLLKNYVNSGRVVSIIRMESNADAADPKKCKRVNRDCSQNPPNLRGRLPIKNWLKHVQNDSFEGIKLQHLRAHEGIWSPQYCSGRHSVAIIIPYRTREKQLRILLHHLPTILKRQRINYSIFVVEQAGNTTFNKGILMNAGFLTALTRPAHGVTFHCFIFHDVDLLAEDDRNTYTCPERPRHLSVAVDEFGYELPYSELLGGVFAISTEHFLQVNGYSNSYWGWGGEDDDMGLRVKFAFGQALRPDQDIGRYSSIQHVKMSPLLPLQARRKLKTMTRVRYKVDGLNTVKYNLVKIEEKYQYTHVFVDVGLPPKDMIYNVMKRNGVYHVLTPKVKVFMEYSRAWLSGTWIRGTPTVSIEGNSRVNDEGEIIVKNGMHELLLGRLGLQGIITIVTILVIVVLGQIIIISEFYMLREPYKNTPPLAITGRGKVRNNRKIRNLPRQEKRPFEVKPLLEMNATSVDRWSQININRLKSQEIVNRIHEESSLSVKPCVPTPFPDCPRVPPNIDGPVPSKWLKRMENGKMDKTGRGGIWSPKNCTSRHSVAIVIPYRDRKEHLTYLMKYLPTLLQKHQISYRIFVVEQTGNGMFNKGILMNAGFLTALERPAHGVTYHCFIFHDVDLLPEDDRNMYTCPERPRHLSVAVNALLYQLPYDELAGGVFGVRTEHFMLLNGYSNLYWGWGGEDDDMGKRVLSVFKSISRPPERVAHYTMVKHRRQKPIPWRVKLRLTRSWFRYEIDGLNTVSYRLSAVTEEEEFTRVLIDVGSPPPYYLKAIQPKDTLPKGIIKEGDRTETTN